MQQQKKMSTAVSDLQRPWCVFFQVRAVSVTQLQ